MVLRDYIWVERGYVGPDKVENMNNESINCR